MIKQGDIYLVDLKPVVGSEQGGKRPVVVVSGNAMNINLGVSIVCPISFRVKGYSACVSLKKGGRTGLECDCEVIMFQTRTVSHKRFAKKLGNVTADELQAIFSGLNDVFRF